MASTSTGTPYDSWTREQLIARLTALEAQTQALALSTPGPSAPFHSPAPISIAPPSAPVPGPQITPASASPPAPEYTAPTTSTAASTSTSTPIPATPDAAPAPRPKSPKAFHFASYPTLKIALKFCYAGASYNGLAYQYTPTPLPTVEGALFDVLAKTRLVDAAQGFEGCGWERCGRTDRGVSGAGQVVSLYVRAAAPHKDPDGQSTEGEGEGEPEPKPLRYLSILNRLLPPTIRILAWAPVAATFSARFSCRARHYKYFFRAGGGGAGALDVGAMRGAAARLVGEHDFRNLCKLDPSKQITNFHRRVLRADVARVADTAAEVCGLPPDAHSAGAGELYVLDLVGTAFLYHQVRHIMAVLFLVGARLEAPDVVSALLNTEPGKVEGAPAVVACKPEYQMADGLPLVLWDCWYAEEDVRWRTDADEGEGAGGAGERKEGVYAQLDAQYTRALISTTLDAHFLAAAARYHRAPGAGVQEAGTGMLNVPLGGGTSKRVGKHVPLLERKRLDAVEVANARYMQGKGGRREERRRAGIEA
ncbi:tRNA pseudouridine synthase [Dentipellis sp. KUC8613]|nr:tRNA pseudouridine synthase [Dentipellis sp. KUC8613]